MEMLVCEDLVLLLTDDESGKVSASTWTAYALAGALLVDLALAGAITVEEKQGFLHSPKVLPVAGYVPTDPLLAEAMAMITAKPRSAQSFVQRHGSKTYRGIAARLAERGILRADHDRVLGLFPRTRWPAVDSTHERQVRTELEDVLLRGLSPQPRTAGLVALLAAVGQVHKVVRDPGVPAKQVKARAKEVAEGDWAAKAVKQAVDSAIAAMTAIMASSGAAAASSS